MAITTKFSESMQKFEQNLVTTTVEKPRWHWYHGIAFYIIIQALTFGLSGLVSITTGKKGKSARDMFIGDVSYFRTLKQAVITPPSWAFAPAWTINNISVIWGNLNVLNKPAGTPGRDAYLALQAASWLDYVLFNAAYFSLRSPINALALTFLMFVVTVASGFIAIFRLKDTRAALSLATLFVWLLIALAAASFQAAWNHDELYNIGPFARANHKLLKKNVN